MRNNELKVTISNICNIIEKLDQPYKKNDFLGLKVSKDNFKILIIVSRFFCLRHMQ